MSASMGGQDCAWGGDEVHVIEEEDPCVLTEGGDVLCKECGTVFLAEFPGEGVLMDRLSDVHEDWRT